MKMKKLMKKLGYKYCLSYNSYTKKWMVFQKDDWDTSMPIGECNVSCHKHPKKAIKKYIKKYIKKSSK